MAYCSNCGTELLGSIKRCPKCGYNMETGEIDRQYLLSLEKSRDVQEEETRENTQGIAPYETGGLMAWSIVTLLLCMIPGIVALVQTGGINNCTTIEEQQKKISSAKTWCIIGTILGCLSLLSAIGNMM